MTSTTHGLKDFQRLTVDTVCERLWGSQDTVPRFLVADEVGLGKTLVARGVVARTIEHLHHRGEERIDIIYICSNRQIASQNLRRLHDGAGAQIPHADRLTLLPTVLQQMRRPRRQGEPAVNIISFTPGTSFHLGSNGGMAAERALLHLLLGELWGHSAVDGAKWHKFFQCGAGLGSMQWERRQIDRSTLTDEVVTAFDEGLGDATFESRPLYAALDDCVDQFRWLRANKTVPGEVSRRRYQIIGQLRQVLAQACIGHLDPDLVILDEFQRFSSLLDGGDDASVLAQRLLGDDTIDPATPHTQTRVLLLSATPFKMYTLPDEPEGDDHYRDFTRTIGFLAGPERADAVRLAMKDMRSALIAGDHEQAVAAKRRAEGELRRVMCRSERLAVSETRDGMLRAHDRLGVKLTADDVRDYTGQSAVAAAVGSPDVLEYWRSAPYVFELMEKYHVKRGIEQDLDAGAPRLHGLLTSRVHRADLQRYGPVDLANPKLRWLADDVLDTGAWRVAWLPPSLPYYSPAGPFAAKGLEGFTKRLVFSAWNVAPKGIATMLSYEVERRLMEAAPAAGRRDYFGERRTGLLAFNKGGDDRLTGMPVLALLYPSTVLARLGDPLSVARELGRTLPLDRSELLTAVRSRVDQALAGLPAGRQGAPRPSGAWYWAAPLLLDQNAGIDASMSGLRFGPDRKSGSGDSDTLFEEHLRFADAVDAMKLGPRPDDLLDVLVELAVAGPGVSALRAYNRVISGSRGLDEHDIRSAASDWAWAMRNLFNTPEIMAMLQGGDAEGTYWRQVLTHALDGNLQAVLDEYADVLMGSRSLGREDRENQLENLAVGFADGAGLRAAQQAMDFFGEEYDGMRERARVRSHFAVRYGRHAAHDDKTVQRESQVRDAFNSPFWPFVLASTSVGQEGLDFHHYSHAVVHWNLPSNPVDLEQREGRVHRYRGHAVRKNIARELGSSPDVVEGRNPWRALFGLATAARAPGQSEIFPDWGYPVEGGASIDRYVPVLPMSRERQQYRRLLRTLGAYRLTLGHPRQSDLLAYVGTDADLALDLAPRQATPTPAAKTPTYGQ